MFLLKADFFINKARMPDGRRVGGFLNNRYADIGYPHQKAGRYAGGNPKQMPAEIAILGSKMNQSAARKYHEIGVIWAPKWPKANHEIAGPGTKIEGIIAGC